MEAQVDEPKPVQFDNTKLNLFFDFQYKSLTETVNLLVKAAGTFYVTIMIALIGYLFTQKISDATRNVIIICAVILTACMFIVGAAICWGVILGITDMRNTLKQYDEALFSNCDLDAFFKRGRKVVLFAIICCVSSMISILLLIFLRFIDAI
jgi:uncharacterized protein YybS (DUF2232 family)